MRSPRSASRRTAAIVAVLLVAAVGLAFAPVRHAGWFYLDDAAYVTENPLVRDGLTLAGLRHAWFGSHGALWMPVAFTSHMLDATVFGLDPTGPHVVNVVLHALAAVLLFLLLVRASGKTAPAAVAAALFAVHPLRVESVAWIAERKDVLSGCFGLLALHAWIGWVRRPTRGRYALVVAAAALAMLSKPMLLSLPVLLLVLDWWPLDRPGAPGPDGERLRPADLVREKLPLFALAAAVAFVTLGTARAEGALLWDRAPAGRLADAALSYAWYAWKTLWPADLGVFYPRTPSTPGQAIAAGLGILAAAGVAIAARKPAPWIAAGLVWFGVALLPVIGLVQAGHQQVADRFTYLPGIGLVVAAVFTLDAAVRWRPARAAMAVGALAVTALLALATYRQADRWRDSETLFAHTIDVTRDNWVAEASLGSLLANRGRHGEAWAHFTAALRARPDYAVAEHGRGIALEGLGRPDEAAAHYRAALRLAPGYWRAHNDLAVVLLRAGRLETALHHLGAAVRGNPAARDPRANLLLVLGRLGMTDAKAAEYVDGLLTWSRAVAEDAAEPEGASYGVALPGALDAALAAAAARCAPSAPHPSQPAAQADVTPVEVFVQLDGDGAVTASSALPPTARARCLRDALQATRAPAPPFAPFHAHLVVAPPPGATGS